MEIWLTTTGTEFLIDEEDVERVARHSWYSSENQRGGGTYVHTSIKDHSGKWRTTYLHRFLVDAEQGEQVDHINRDTLDYRKHNLRTATQTQNNANMGLPKHNTSGFKGVCSRRGRWEASIQFQRRHITLGLFESKEEAARAYDRKARELHGEFAGCNFPA